MISATAILTSSIMVVGCSNDNADAIKNAEIVAETTASDSSDAVVKVDAATDTSVEVDENGVKVGAITVDKKGIKIPAEDSAKVDSNASININTKTNNSTDEVVNDDSLIECSNTNPTANVTGANREVVITGKCTNINVTGINLEVVAEQADKLLESGANNEVEINLVDDISVEGTNSVVNYTSNSNNKAAKVSITGVNANVERN